MNCLNRLRLRLELAHSVAVMTDTILANQALADRKHAGTWQLFLGLLAAVTMLPFGLVPVVAHMVPEGSPALYAYGLILFLSTNFHVASTGWFFTDREMRGHLRAHPLRYAVAPLAVIAACAAGFQWLGPAVADGIVVVFVGWLLWHYQKQNIGLLSFVAAGTDGVPLSLWERRTLLLTAVAGIAGVFSAAQVAPAYLSNEAARLHEFGAIAYLLVPVCVAVAVVKSASLRANRLRLFFFLVGAAFYLPVYIFADPVSAVTGSATAHGLQYLVFMGTVSGSGQRSLKPVLVMLAIAGAGAPALNYAADAGGALKGLFVGGVMAHFIVDAGIWRLREVFQRGYMRRKFYFVFDR
jgi:small-conductance mechanosensitive channel